MSPFSAAPQAVQRPPTNQAVVFAGETPPPFQRSNGPQEYLIQPAGQRVGWLQPALAPPAHHSARLPPGFFDLNPGLRRIGPLLLKRPIRPCSTRKSND